MQFLELVIFGVLAAVVLYNLYAVLGRRIGRQPEDAAATAPGAPASDRPDAALGGPAPEVELTGLAALKAKDPAFEVDSFLQGARSAYEIIVQAYADGDREALRALLSPQVMAAFEGGIAAREAEGRTEKVEFHQPPRADLEHTEVEGDLARTRVRFLAEFRTRSKGPEGEAVDDRRTAEVWTFERNLASRDPNWTLVRVDAAEV